MVPLIDPSGPSLPTPNHTSTPRAAESSSSSSSLAYERPRPRPPRTPAHAARVRVRNRRREWLSRHPSYLRSLEHELADPVLYDALIRRFQSHEEREREGRAKGFSRVLEVDLLRGEARLSKVAGDSGNGSGDGSFVPGAVASVYDRIPRLSRVDASSSSSSAAAAEARLRALGARTEEEEEEEEEEMNREELEALEMHDLEKRAAPRTAEEGRTRWDEFLRLRFIAGGDDDFNYRPVDEDDEYDALERREQEDAWFDNEEPSWVGESDDDDDNDNDPETGPVGAETKMNVERPLMGETGVQDF